MIKEITEELAFEKMKHYCAWQERCCSEIKNKLLSLGLNKNDRENILAKLIAENYINEERFAKLFAGSKFRIKKWGKYKIEQALKEKRISEENIAKGMEEIEDAAYNKTLEILAKDKWKTTSEATISLRKRKVEFYLRQKGYELHLIFKAIKKIGPP